MDKTDIKENELHLPVLKSERRHSIYNTHAEAHLEAKEDVHVYTRRIVVGGGGGGGGGERERQEEAKGGKKGQEGARGGKRGERTGEVRDG